MSLQSEILGEINRIRVQLYGTESLILLREDGVTVKFTEGPELTRDWIVSFDRTGNMTFRLFSSSFNDWMLKVTHLVFQGWIYHLTEPSKPEQGPFPSWKATGRPIGSRYVYGA